MRTSSMAVVLAMLIAAPAFAAAPEAASPLPLQLGRTVEFTTTQGTWMSLDVSPDGRTLVFDLLGDLYTLPIEGGRATRLTEGISYDAQPRYSPDGREILFVSDRSGAENVWLMGADGSHPRALTHETYSRFISPSFTPDGRTLLVSRRTPYFYGPSFELWLYHREGGGGVKVVRTASGAETSRDDFNNVLGAVASPDGQYFYYSYARGYLPSFSESNGQYRSMPFWQIRRRSRTTGEEMTVTAASGSALRPVLSPDGRWLVYGTRNRANTDLRLRDLKTGADRLLKSAIQRDDQESYHAALDLLPGYAFMPDGQSVIAAYDGQIHRISLADGAASVIPMTVQVTQSLGPSIQVQNRLSDGPVVARLIQRPTLSADGRRLAFSAFGQLYLKTLPDGKPKALTAGLTGGYQPVWSPDGRWLLYVTWSGRQGGALWKVRVEGSSKPIRLTNDSAYYRDPVWAPDGTRVFALRMAKRDFLAQSVDMGMDSEHGDEPVEFDSGNGTSASPDIVWVDSKGGEAHVIAAANGLTRPHFGPDHTKLFFSAGAGLASMRLDGSERRMLLQLTGTMLSVHDANMNPATLLSPDGKFVLARFRSKVYLMPMMWPGLSPLTVDFSAPVVPALRLDRYGADDIGWSMDGRTVTWSLGATLFSSAATEGHEGTFGRHAVNSIAIRIERPRARASGAVLLSGGRIVTMKGDEVIADGDVLIVDGRIASIGQRGSLDMGPKAPRRIDVSGMTLIPGMIDLHPHTLSLRRGVLDLETWQFINYLAYGVTTGRDPSTLNADQFVYEDLVEAGDIPGYRSVSTGPAVFSSNELHSLSDAVDVATRYKQFYGVQTIKSYIVGNRQQQQWMVSAAKQLGLMATTEGGDDFRLDMTHVMDGFSGNEHVLPYAPLYDDVVQLFVRSGITYTPALLETYGGPGPTGFSAYYQDIKLYSDPKVLRFYPSGSLDQRRRGNLWIPPDERFTRQLAQAAATIAKAGGRVCVGSHGNFVGLGYHWNLWALVDGGLTPHEALRAATLQGAEGIGYAADLGSIESGKRADILVLRNNPLEDIRHTADIRFVMKDGVVYDGDTLDEVWPTQRKRTELWWWAQ